MKTINVEQTDTLLHITRMLLENNKVDRETGKELLAALWDTYHEYFPFKNIEELKSYNGFWKSNTGVLPSLINLIVGQTEKNNWIKHDSTISDWYSTLNCDFIVRDNAYSLTYDSFEKKYLLLLDVLGHKCSVPEIRFNTYANIKYDEVFDAKVFISTLNKIADLVKTQRILERCDNFVCSFMITLQAYYVPKPVHLSPKYLNVSIEQSPLLTFKLEDIQRIKTICEENPYFNIEFEISHVGSNKLFYSLPFIKYTFNSNKFTKHGWDNHISPSYDLKTFMDVMNNELNSTKVITPQSNQYTIEESVMEIKKLFFTNIDTHISIAKKMLLRSWDALHKFFPFATIDEMLQVDKIISTTDKNGKNITILTELPVEPFVKGTNASYWTDYYDGNVIITDHFGTGELTIFKTDVSVKHKCFINNFGTTCRIKDLTFVFNWPTIYVNNYGDEDDILSEIHATAFFLLDEGVVQRCDNFTCVFNIHFQKNMEAPAKNIGAYITDKIKSIFTKSASIPLFQMSDFIDGVKKSEKLAVLCKKYPFLKIKIS